MSYGACDFYFISKYLQKYKKNDNHFIFRAIQILLSLDDTTSGHVDQFLSTDDDGEEEDDSVDGGNTNYGRP